MRAVALSLAALIVVSACKGDAPARGAVKQDAAVELRARPPELAYVTLKVVGMT